jgi:ParB-like chromosome segregation protein Spo0J
VVTINQHKEDKGDRIASTIRHNRARGKHKIDSMSDIVVDLKRRNWSDAKIAKQLGMDADEVLRLSQISGLIEMFEDEEFSQSWDLEVE